MNQMFNVRQGARANGTGQLHRLVWLLVLGLGWGAVTAQAVLDPGVTFLSDQFSGSNGAAVAGRTPDTVNLPGGTWSTAVGFGTFGLPAPAIDTSVGNPLPAATSGPNDEMWVPISSTPIFTKPTKFMISGDLRLDGYNADGSTARGIALGFYGAGGPNNSNAGHLGVSNFDGLWLNAGNGAGSGALYLRENGNSNDQFGVLPLVSTYDSAALGAWNPNQFYRLSYWVDTSAGTIFDITLSDSVGTQFVAGSFGGAGDFTDANTAFAGLQFVSGSSSGLGSVDNLSLTAVLPEPSTVLLFGLGGYILRWRRSSRRPSC